MIMNIMAKTNPNIIFLGIPSMGHILPTLSLVKALLQLKCKVTYYNTKNFQEIIERSGASFIEYQSPTFDSLSIPITIMEPHELTVELQKAFFSVNNEVLPQIISDHQKLNFDLVIYDQMALWGQVFADKFKLLCFCSNTMFLFNKHDIIIQLPELVNCIDSDYEVKLSLIQKNLTSIKSYGDILDIQTAARADYIIAYYPSNLHSAPSNFNNNKILYLGNRFDSKYSPSTARLIPSSLIYISLGTVFNDKPDLFKLFIQILGNTEYKVIVSTGGNERIFELLEQENRFNNITIYKFVDQLDILSKASIFITHAGFNGIYEGLYFTVPMLMIPHAPEQYFNAQKIAELCAGYFLDLAITPYENFTLALETVEANWGNYKNTLLNIRKNILESANNLDTAQCLIEIANHEKDNRHELENLNIEYDSF